MVTGRNTKTNDNHDQNITIQHENRGGQGTDNLFVENVADMLRHDGTVLQPIRQILDSRQKVSRRMRLGIEVHNETFGHICSFHGVICFITAQTQSQQVQRKVTVLITSVDRVPRLRVIQQEAQYIWDGISMSVYHRQVHGSTSFVFFGSERFRMNFGQHFQNGRVRSIGASVMNRIHASTVAQSRRSRVTEKLSVHGHLTRISKVSCRIKVQRRSHLIVLLQFSGWISIDKNLHDFWGSSVGTSMMKGQPAVRIRPGSNFWSRIYESGNHIWWWIR
mmetsp:Transcript_936/g.1865  ORF Transcript_936/g.1865 Transcript_936/m.1865 type:complete len:277 (-) Transcript_936:635-1465(-)